MTIGHQAALVLFWVVLGSSVGSFLNVCAYRIPRGMSLSRPRSRCPGCGVPIRARDNVPVLGWLMLRGHCRGCRAPISARYPAVELAVGLLFAMPYVVVVAIGWGDPWEHIGAGRMILVLMTSWTIGVVAAWKVLVGPPGWPAIIGRRAAGGFGAPASTGLPRRAGAD